MFKLVLAPILGLSSAFLSYYLSYSIVPKSDVWGVIPGVVFGVFIVGYLYIIKQSIPLLKAFLFILGSTGAYYLGVWTTEILGVFTSQNMSIDSAPSITPPLALLVGGFVGTFLLSLAIRFFVTKIPSKKNITFICVGTVLALGWYIIPDTSHHFESTLSGFFSLLIVWQTVMLPLIGVVIKKNK